MYNLFLDDERFPKDVKWMQLPPLRWIIVRNFEQFVNIIQRNGLPNAVSFDHDLADEHYVTTLSKNSYKEKTGYECAKWLIEYCIEKNLNFPKYTVHSLNPIGKQNIISLIDSYIKSKNL
jgi:hypothetical protein